MSKKTLALIISLVGVTIVLFAVALLSNNATVTNPGTKVAGPTPTPEAQSLLMLTPNPVDVTSSRSGSIDVVLDTQMNEATAIQLELAYDPQVLSNVTVTPGPLFTVNNTPPDNIIDTNDTQNGRITYALVLPLAQPAVKGKGIVAKISFTQRASLSPTALSQGTTQLQLLPKSLVTAEGVSKSVLKEATGATINLFTPNKVTTTQTQPQNIPQTESPTR